MIAKQDTNKYGKILAFLVLGILMVSALDAFAGQSVASERAKNLVEMQGRANHAPIHIDGDTNFTNMAASEGWAGDGSQQNPYIIEGYDIDANGGTYCIWIENTTVYFVIRNCYGHNAVNGAYPYGSGFALTGVQNGTIVNNTLSNNGGHGIFLENSSKNEIMNNIANGNCWDGICLYSSTFNSITANNIYSNEHCGIALVHLSNNNTLTNNVGRGNLWNGIYVGSSNNNTITSNDFRDNYEQGIYLEASTYNTITYNWFCSNQQYGAYITAGSTNNTIYRNNFIGNRGAGKGITDGICQAYDNAGGNSWYDNIAQQGNYWSNWDGTGWGTSSAYPIDGGVASDWYPLSGAVPELSGLPVALGIFGVFLAFTLMQRRKIR